MVLDKEELADVRLIKLCYRNFVYDFFPEDIVFSRLYTAESEGETFVFGELALSGERYDLMPESKPDIDMSEQLDVRSLTFGVFVQSKEGQSPRSLIVVKKDGSRTDYEIKGGLLRFQRGSEEPFFTRANHVLVDDNNTILFELGTLDPQRASATFYNYYGGIIDFSSVIPFETCPLALRVKVENITVSDPEEGERQCRLILRITNRRHRNKILDLLVRSVRHLSMRFDWYDMRDTVATLMVDARLGTGGIVLGLLDDKLDSLFMCRCGGIVVWDSFIDRYVGSLPLTQNYREVLNFERPKLLSYPRCFETENQQFDLDFKLLRKALLMVKSAQIDWEQFEAWCELYAVLLNNRLNVAGSDTRLLGIAATMLIYSSLEIRYILQNKNDPTSALEEFLVGFERQIEILEKAYLDAEKQV